MTDMRILIVDDHQQQREWLQTVVQYDLAPMGIVADYAASGEEALALLEKNTYSLMLTDFSMPGISGLELTRRVRADARFGAMKIIGRSSDNMEPGFRLAGADEFVKKKFMDNEIIAAAVYRQLNVSQPAPAPTPQPPGMG